jgi:hypothetical protein
VPLHSNCRGTDHIENIVLLLSYECMLRELPSNSRFLRVTTEQRVYMQQYEYYHAFMPRFLEVSVSCKCPFSCCLCISPLCVSSIRAAPFLLCLVTPTTKYLVNSANCEASHYAFSPVSDTLLRLQELIRFALTAATSCPRVQTECAVTRSGPLKKTGMQAAIVTMRNLSSHNAAEKTATIPVTCSQDGRPKENEGR